MICRKLSGVYDIKMSGSIQIISVTSPPSTSSITVRFRIAGFSPSTINVELTTYTGPSASQTLNGISVSENLTIVGAGEYQMTLGEAPFNSATQEYSLQISAVDGSTPVMTIEQYNRGPYTVAYDKNDGVTSTLSSSVRAKNSTFDISFSGLPTRSGYTFAGWNTTAGGEPPGVFYPYPVPPGGPTSFTVLGNTTLYAQWAPGGGAVCFLGSAPVQTPAGWARIDSLAVGDLVRTADGRDVAVVRVKHQRIEVPSAAVNPYVIPAGQFGATENLAISPRHCVAVPGSGMVEARFLGLKQMPMRAAFDYYNLELPEWDNMVVAGVEVESLAPKKQVAMTVAQFAALAASMPAEKRANLMRQTTVVEGGKVSVSLTRKERRMRA
jgi:uncharacterized repeat protein (TIGR02543 family)